MSTESIIHEIARQTSIFNDLRTKNTDLAAVDEAKKKLAELKKYLHSLSGTAGAKDAGKKKERLLLKTAKVRT
jgi:histidyl-tRNA synthetase